MHFSVFTNSSFMSWNGICIHQIYLRTHIRKLWDHEQLDLQQKEELGIFWMPHIIFELEGIHSIFVQNLLRQS